MFSERKGGIGVPVTQYYPIGSITLPSSWIAFIASFIVIYLFIRLYFGKVHGERIGDAFFYVVIIWKLSVILTDFSMVRQNPLSILYFHGGRVGWILGLITASALMIRRAYTERWARIDRWALLLGLVAWQAVYQVIMVFLNEGSLLAKVGTVLIFAVLIILVWWSERKGANTVAELAAIVVAGHFFVSALQGNLVNNAFIATIFIGLLLWILERMSAQPIGRKEEVK